jgi:hypothetical protein
MAAETGPVFPIDHLDKVAKKAPFHLQVTRVGSKQQYFTSKNVSGFRYIVGNTVCEHYFNSVLGGMNKFGYKRH